MEDTEKWSEQIVQAVAFAHHAHATQANSAPDMVRFHDRRTPYLAHPLWCAATLLQEPALPLVLRQHGYLALLWHDVLEDTRASLPPDTPPEVVKLVQEMSFASFAEEQQMLWQRSLEVKLLKLYDKTSNLLDGAWMSTPKWNAYVAHTLRLAHEVAAHFGDLNIIKIAKAIALAR